MFFSLHKPTACYGFIRNKADSALPIFTVGNHMSRKFIDYINIYPWCAERNFNIRIWYFMRDSFNLFFNVNDVLLFLKNLCLMIHFNPFIKSEFFQIFFRKSINNFFFGQIFGCFVDSDCVILRFINGIIPFKKLTCNLFAEQICIDRCRNFICDIPLFFLCKQRQIVFDKNIF